MSNDMATDQSSRAGGGNDLDRIIAEFEQAAEPYGQYRSTTAPPGGAAAALEVIGLVVGMASLLVSLIQWAEARLEKGRSHTPDFRSMLDDLVEGRLSPVEARDIVRSWRPDLTAVEVADLLSGGQIDAYRDVLVRLGYPEDVADAIVREATRGLLAGADPEPPVD